MCIYYVLESAMCVPAVLESIYSGNKQLAFVSLWTEDQ